MLVFGMVVQREEWKVEGSLRRDQQMYLLPSPPVQRKKGGYDDPVKQIPFTPHSPINGGIGSL